MPRLREEHVVDPIPAQEGQRRCVLRHLAVEEVGDRHVDHTLFGERPDIRVDLEGLVAEVEAALDAVRERARVGRARIELCEIVDNADQRRVVALHLILNVLKILEKLPEVAGLRRLGVVPAELLARPVQHRHCEAHAPLAQELGRHAVAAPRVALARQDARDPQRQRSQPVAAAPPTDAPHFVEGRARSEIAHHTHRIMGVEVSQHLTGDPNRSAPLDVVRAARRSGPRR